MKYLFLCISFLLFVGCTSKSPQKAVVSVGNKDGVVSTKKDVIVKPIYKRIHRFSESNETYFHPNYINIHWFHGDRDKQYAIVENIDGKYGVIDASGKLVLKVVYDHIGSFFNGFARIQLNNRYGLINEDFEIVLKPVYDEVQEFVFNTAIVKYKGKYGCIDQDINLVLKPIYDMMYLQKEEMKRIELDDKWGFVDMDCQIVAKPIYDYAHDFSNGFAKVKTANKWAYLKKDGTLYTKTIFGDLDEF